MKYRSEAGIYGFHKTEDESYSGIGSGHDYHCKSSLPEYEISGCKEHHDSSVSGIYEDDTDPKDTCGPCLGSRHDYHLVSGGKLTDYYDTGSSFVESRGALFYTHIAEEEWIRANNRGSMQN